MGSSVDGAALCAPTSQFWSETLWEHYKRNYATGMFWHIADEKPQNRQEAQSILLEKIDNFLNRKGRGGAALIIDNRSSTTYSDLKKYGSQYVTMATFVFLLFGGDRGFDGDYDRDTSFLDRLINCFEKHLGETRVAKVCISNSATVNLVPSQIAAYLRVEADNGALYDAVAGAEYLAHRACKGTEPNSYAK